MDSRTPHVVSSGSLVETFGSLVETFGPLAETLYWLLATSTSVL
jgi:hypothetical protein